MTMKRQLPILIFTLLSLVIAKAEVISQDDARQKAMSFLTNRFQTGKKAAVRSTQKQLKVAESCETYYIFNVGDADGYVVVSSDDGMPDILGYSDNGRFETQNIPENMRVWLQRYEKQYEYLKSHPEAKLTSRGSDSREPIAPMLDCQWDQWSPYNDQCPNDCPTGCVATAMAQIMYYHKWPKQTTKTIPSYTSYTNRFFIPSIEVTNIDWDNMLPTYDNSSSEESRKAVSTLMKLCGAAVNMDYESSGSGAYIDHSVFADYFGYERGFDLNEKDYSLDKWNNIIYEEIKNKRPVLYTGAPKLICDGDLHALVVDGYDSNDYFHMNFGWGGRGDAYFLLTAISPENYDFSFYQSAVVRIQPTSSTNPKPYMTLDNGTLTYRYDCDKDKSKTKTYAFPFSLEDLKEVQPHITHVRIDPSFAYNCLYTLSSFFSGFHNLETIEGLEYLNTSIVYDMGAMFSGCSALTSLDVSKLNTSNVTNMGSMFSGCSALTSLDLRNFDTANVTDMGSMFSGCSALTSLDLRNFDTANVKDMGSMFSRCSALTSLDVSKFNTSNVKGMGYMFYCCSSLTSLDLRNFDTANVTDMLCMFYACSALTTIYCEDAWSCENSNYMFSGCSSLEGAIEYDSNKTNAIYANPTDGYFYSADIIVLRPYAILSDGNTKLTFYYNGDKKTKGGMSVGPLKNNWSCGWYEQRKNITTVVFEDSFSDCTSITSTAYWFYECTNLTSINGMDKLNTANVTDMKGMFYNCSKLTSLDVSKFNTANVTDMSSMFYGCSGLTSLDVNKFNTANVTNMSWMFYACSLLTTIYCEAAWSCENSNYMFSGCSSLEGAIEYDYNKTNAIYANPTDGYFYSADIIVLRPYAVLSDDNTKLTFYYNGDKKTKGGMSVGPLKNNWSSGWYKQRDNITAVVFDDSFADCTSITSTASWFYGCSNLTSIDGMDKLNTANVTNMQSMFSGCSGLTSLDVSKFNTANVTDMSSMFYGCSRLTSLDVSKFDTDNVTNMYQMFYNCSDLSTIYCKNAWSCENSSEMFYGCLSLEGAMGYSMSKTNATYANPTHGYFYSSLIPLPYALLSDDNTTLTFYYDCDKKVKGGMSVGPFTYDWSSGVNSGWYKQHNNITMVVFDDSFADCTSITSTAYWFHECTNVTSINGMANLNTVNVTDMKYMFNNCSKLTSLDVSKFNTDNVTDMSNMFSGCSGLTRLDVSKFNTANVTSMYSMFSRCSKLTSLDVSKFNTDNVTNMYSMFSYCFKLKSLDVSKFNTVNVTSMEEMFLCCSCLTNLDVSKFNTAKVRYMSGMFRDCSGLTSLDLNKFNTANVTNMSNMFSGCSGLTSLDVSKFNTDNVTNMYSMFSYCSKLKSLDVSKFNTANVTSMYSMFCGCSGLTTIYCNDSWSCNSSNNMFYNCPSLVGAISYDETKTDVTYANPKTGYFTKKNKVVFLGDANGDGVINDADVEIVKDFIMGNEPDNFVFEGADANEDEKVNVADIVIILNKKE